MSHIFRVFVFLLVFTDPAYAHTDLQEQIEHLTGQLSDAPQNTQLLLRRGDLYRRHGDWAAAERDFTAVRRLQPDQTQIDWYEGRLLVASGRYRDGEALLTRFIEQNPGNGGAYQDRAIAYGNIGQPLLEAADYQSAIDNSERPSPSLFRSAVLAYVAAGIEHVDAALSAANDGLGRFPEDFSLLGLATDLSLSQSNSQLTKKYMDHVPAGVMELPQWKFRKALRTCIEGEVDDKPGLFSAWAPDASKNEAIRTGTWTLPPVLSRTLTTKPDAGLCSQSAWEMLRLQYPWTSKS